MTDCRVKSDLARYEAEQDEYEGAVVHAQRLMAEVEAAADNVPWGHMVEKMADMAYKDADLIADLVSHTVIPDNVSVIKALAKFKRDASLLVAFDLNAEAKREFGDFAVLEIYAARRD